MKRLPLYLFIGLIFSSCDGLSQKDAYTETIQSESMMFPSKIVQCIFAFDYEDIMTISGRDNVLQTADMNDISIFDHTLGLLVGYDISLPILIAETDSSSYVPSYADCDTTEQFINVLAKKHVNGRINGTFKTVDPQAYLALAKRYKIEVDKEAFQPVP